MDGTSRACHGDPSRIALRGQSEEVSSASYYLYAWLGDPIVHAFIADSGAFLSRGSIDATHSNFTALAGMVGCGRLDTTEELRCMQEVDARVPEDTLSTSNTSMRSSPSADGPTLFSNYTGRMAQGNMSKIVCIHSRPIGPRDFEAGRVGSCSSWERTPTRALDSAPLTPNGMPPDQYPAGLATENCPVSKAAGRTMAGPAS